MKIVLSILDVIFDIIITVFKTVILFIDDKIDKLSRWMHDNDDKIKHVEEILRQNAEFIFGISLMVALALFIILITSFIEELDKTEAKLIEKDGNVATFEINGKEYEYSRTLFDSENEWAALKIGEICQVGFTNCDGTSQYYVSNVYFDTKGEEK